jgi:membrane-bound metal-dependent hydrolase YbcI (DUF457 family)
MQGPSHLLVSWFVAESLDVESPRDRRIVAWAGFAPDFDVAAYVAALVYYRGDQGLAFENVWSVVHHRYTHGTLFVLLVAIAAYFLADRRPGGAGPRRVALLAALMAALHCFLDVVAGGPTWPIYPYWPASDFGWTVPWSWTIGEWPNLAILYGCLGGALLYGRLMGRSPMECFGDRADRWLVGVLRQERTAPRALWNRQRIIIWLCVLLAIVAILIPLRPMLFGG